MGNFSLMLIAIFAALVCFVPFLLVKLYSRDSLTEWFKRVALSLDQTLNVVGDSVFNHVWIKSNGYRFGAPDETISSVLGKNYKRGTLTWFGELTRRFLYLIEKDHAVLAIELDEFEPPEVPKENKTTWLLRIIIVTFLIGWVIYVNA